MLKILRNREGFTLVEMLITITILVFISMGVAQIVWNTYRLRDKLLVEGEFYTGVRQAMSVLDRDIALMFSPIMQLPEGLKRLTPDDVANLSAITQTAIDRSSDFYTPMISKNGIKPSRFVGEKDKISFVTTSHRKIYKGVPESVFSKIVYEVRSDRFAKDDLEDTNILMKVANTNAFTAEDDDRDPYLRTYPLLPGVEKIKFQFYRKDKDQWVDRWDSEKEETRNIFPDMIKMEIEIKGPRNLSYSGEYQFKPELPLYGIPSSI